VVLTHGFVVDGIVHKMSKSLGNVIAPQEVIEKYGADILRLWVATSDYREDVRLSQDIVKHVVDIYRRFRNTFRFLLQNTSDFSWGKHAVPTDQLSDVDRWILIHFEEIKARVKDAYESYQFHLVLSELNRFVSVMLSGFYLDAIKDLLYCEEPNSKARRSAQTVLFHLTRGLAVLTAPLLTFTAEETYLELKKISGVDRADLTESVLLDRIDALESVSFDRLANERLLKLLNVRGAVNDELDRQRKTGAIKSSQEAAVSINRASLKDVAVVGDIDWRFALQMAEVSLKDDVLKDGQPAVEMRASAFTKCARCWRHRDDVGADARFKDLCSRCARVVAALAPA
jgi:isoleucyl-tRNA synthetase